MAALVRLAAGDFSVRLPRNHRRDEGDTLAYMVNLVAEEIDRLVRERDRTTQELQAGITALSEHFVRFAAGHFSVRAERSGRGDPFDVLAFLFNNTVEEVGEAFRELDRQKTVLEAILESMIDGLLLLDGEGRVLRVNGAIANLLGAAPSDLIGLHVADVLAPAEHETVRALRQVGARAHEPLRGRSVFFRTRGGDEIQLTLSAAPCVGSDGALVGVIAVIRDERQLKRAQAEKMTDRLAAMGMVAAGVAHEMNNPLAYVLANLGFALEELEGASQREPALRRTLSEAMTALRSAQAGADRVRDIVRAFRTFADADRGRTELVDLDALVDASVAMLRNEVAHHAGLVVQKGQPPAVLANEGRLGQVVANLLQNAAQAVPPGAAGSHTVRIATGTAADGAAFVEVEDTGTGIAPEILPSIWDAFFTTKPVGTGIGLFISRQIVTALGGRIEVTSTVGRGSLFRVTLPAAKPAEATSPEPAGPIPPPERSRLLVVDDVPEVARSVQRMLSRDHDVDVATTGNVALALIDERPYDLIICDLMMPDVSGMEVHARVLADRPALAPRILFMTGGTFTPGAADFLERVKNPRLLKPFTPAELRDAVGRLLRDVG